MGFTSSWILTRYQTPPQPSTPNPLLFPMCWSKRSFQFVSSLQASWCPPNKVQMSARNSTFADWSMNLLFFNSQRQPTSKPLPHNHRVGPCQNQEVQCNKRQNYTEQVVKFHSNLYELHLWVASLQGREGTVIHYCWLVSSVQIRTEAHLRKSSKKTPHSHCLYYSYLCFNGALKPPDLLICHLFIYCWGVAIRIPQLRANTPPALTSSHLTLYTVVAKPTAPAKVQMYITPLSTTQMQL